MKVTVETPLHELKTAEGEPLFPPRGLKYFNDNGHKSVDDFLSLLNMLEATHAERPFASLALASGIHPERLQRMRKDIQGMMGVDVKASSRFGMEM